ncbi:MAG: VOC family protein [Pseudolabrys sp.]|nr:VOC family protein [Pseudolabrys sp.]
MQKIVTSLFFQGNAEEALALYTSIFKNAKVTSRSYYGDHGPEPKGTLMAATFTLDGQEFFAINGKAPFNFTEAMSLMVRCEAQTEIDHYWCRLTADGGQEIQCGWLKDKFGVFWQIVPAKLGEWMKDARRGNAVMTTLVQMKKLDIATLQQAYDNA